MKKIYFLLSVVLLLQTATFAQKNPSWSWPQCKNTSGGSPEQPAAVYLGDYGTFGCDSWGMVDGKWSKWRVFIHTTPAINNGTAGSWSSYGNSEHKTNTSPMFTNTGTWYWGMQVEYTDAGGTTGWYCLNLTSWTDMYGTPNSDLTINVDPINIVSTPNALQSTTNPSTQIDLEWTKNAEGHNVMIVRKKIYQSWTAPTQGTGYNVGNTIGDGVVVYNSNGTSYTNTGLASSTDYEYKFYSVNNNYYSDGVTQNIYTAFAAGDGTIGSPFQVANADGLYCARHYTNTTMYGGNFIQTTDIDLSGVYAEGEGWLPINDLQGSYNGNGHTISNLTINRPTDSYVGLFSTVSTGVISNLGLTNVNIIGYYYVGSFAATIRLGIELSSTVQLDKCYATGTVSVGAGGIGYYVGGLVGQLAAPISLCYSTCAVNNANPNTHQYVGGLVGGANGGSLGTFTNITNCYATGAVTAGNTITWAEIGGLVGSAAGDVNFQNCFASGLVTCSDNTFKDGLVGRCWGNAKSTGSFYDYQTTGQSPTSSWYPGETGKTTAEMKTAGTFLAANWDFSSTGAWAINGTTNNGYPYLRFQGAASNYIWLGTSTTAWATPGNWSENAAPASDKVVIIPDVTNNPIITTAAAATNLTVETGGVLTIANTGSLTVSGTLSNTATETGLVIQSGASGTGSLIHSTADVPATVERYLTKYDALGDNMYHFISSPVAEQAIRSEFVTDPPTTGHDFYSWDEVQNKWINTRAEGDIWNTLFEDNFEIGKGYMVAYPADVTKNFTGALNSYPSGLEKTCTNTAADRGWNLLGNPFASAIDWSSVTCGDGMDNALYYYDNATSNYKYWIKLEGETSASVSGGQRYIPAMQGFMVHAKTTGTNKTVTLSNAARTHLGQDKFYKSTNTAPNSLTLKVSANGYEDEMLVHFTQGATEAFDGSYDAYKLRSYNANVPAIYTMGSDGSELAINGLPEMAENTVVPVYFKAGKDGDYTIAANLLNITNEHINLVDLKLDVTQNLSINPVYNYTASTTDEVNRFKLTIGTTGTPNPSCPEALRIYANAGNIYLSGATGKAEVLVRNMLGQTVMQRSVNGDALKVINATNLKAGVYIVSVVSSVQTISTKVIIK